MRRRELRATWTGWSGASEGERKGYGTGSGDPHSRGSRLNLPSCEMGESVSASRIGVELN